MSNDDEWTTKMLAVHIIDGVRDDDRTPFQTLENASKKMGIPIDTLLLWLAQMVVKGISK